MHKEVIHKVIDYAKEIGFSVCNLDYSPIKGPEGNIEYLLHLSKDKTVSGKDISVDKVVEDSHEELR